MNDGIILVTGGCGYLGAHLLRQLAADDRYAGVRVRVLDNLSAGSVRAIMDLPAGPRYEFLEGDIMSPGTVRAALDGVDTVIHLAAIVRTPFAFDQPTSIHQVNHWGTARLLEHCREGGVRRFLYPSSVSVYGPGGTFNEDESCRPVGPYSCSKHDAERAVLIANGEVLSTTVLRLATLYGGEPHLARFDAVGNRFVYLAGIHRSLTVFGSGEQTRPVLHVRDAARALLWAHCHDGIGGATYNVAEANPAIGELARAIERLWPDVRIRYTDQDYREHLSLSVSTDKITHAGWRPVETLTNGLGELLTHFRSLASAQVDQSAAELAEWQD